MTMYHVIEPLIVALIGLASLAWLLRTIAPSIFARLTGRRAQSTANAAQGACGSGGCSRCGGCGLARKPQDP